MTSLFSLRRISAAAPLCALAGILLFAARGRAEELAAKPKPMENRFLFVIDTSSAMKSRNNGVQQAVNGLLASGMEGELRKGDTIGVWTYGESLNTDFPMQVWSAEKKEAIETKVRQYLQTLRYEKGSKLEKVLPVIGNVLASSERLTIILVFDGTDEIKGTPFDKDLKDLHKRYAHAFRSSHQPFVTLLAARNGLFFDYTINYPGAVLVPHTALPLPPPETNAPPPVLAAKPLPPQIAAPPPEPKPPARKIEIILSAADFAPKTNTPPPAASNVVAAVAPPTPAPAPVVITNHPPPAEAAPVPVLAVSSNVAQPESKRAPQPAPIVPAPAKTVAVAPVPAVPAVVAAIAPAAVRPVAAATPPVSSGQQTAMFIMAFSLLTIAVVLVLFLVRRWRGGSPPSLISQSIDRTR